jgi:D-ribose pyranose/furanose isomerase RbsD
MIDKEFEKRTRQYQSSLIEQYKKVVCSQSQITERGNTVSCFSLKTRNEKAVVRQGFFLATSGVVGTFHLDGHNITEIKWEGNDE